MVSVRKLEYIIFVATLIIASTVFVFTWHLTHFSEFMLHLAAIPLEVLVGVFIVEKYLNNREKKEKQRQLMFIKSCLFRSELFNLYFKNFNALKSPNISFSKIKNSTLDELKQMRKACCTIEYKSLEAMEPVIIEYSRAEKVWHDFKHLAITYDFEQTFHDMIYILHFVYDFKLFKENNPNEFFIHDTIKKPFLFSKVERILSDGIRKYLDYAIELKEKEPAMFDELISLYEKHQNLYGMT